MKSEEEASLAAFVFKRAPESLTQIAKARRHTFYPNPEAANCPQSADGAKKGFEHQRPKRKDQCPQSIRPRNSHYAYRSPNTDEVFAESARSGKDALIPIGGRVRRVCGRTLLQSSFATVATRRGESSSLTLQRPQARPARLLPGVR